MSRADRQEGMEQIAALLRAESTLALATVNEQGQAWVTPVFYIADDSLFLYWLSSARSAHSRNLAREPRASASVYRKTDAWREICGVQMRGVVSAIDDKQRRHELVDCYCQRFRLSAIFRLPISECILYSFRPQWIRYMDNSQGLGYRFEIEVE